MVEHLKGIEAFQLVVMELLPEIEAEGLTVDQIKEDMVDQLKSEGITSSRQDI